SVQYSDSDNWLPLTDRILTKNQAYDDRDVLLDSNNIPTYSVVKAIPRNFHHVTIRNLEAGKQYYFRVNGNLRTFVPELNTATTLTQVDKVGEPDTVYSKVTNYMEDGDNPQDGIVYYRVVNINDDNDYTELYSATIDTNSAWSSDLSNLHYEDGTAFTWDKDNYKIYLETRNTEGYGWADFTLAEYKPLPDFVSNIRYIPESSGVLGLSTDMARVDDDIQSISKPKVVAKTPTSTGGKSTGTAKPAGSNGSTTKPSPQPQPNPQP